MRTDSIRTYLQPVTAFDRGFGTGRPKCSPGEQARSPAPGAPGDGGHCPVIRPIRRDLPHLRLLSQHDCHVLCSAHVESRRLISLVGWDRCKLLVLSPKGGIRGDAGRPGSVIRALLTSLVHWHRVCQNKLSFFSMVSNRNHTVQGVPLRRTPRRGRPVHGPAAVLSRAVRRGLG